MRKAFTITELLVAIGLLVAVLTISGVVFNYSIDAQRTSAAAAEIMRNLRAIIDQLNSDLAARYPESPLVVGFDPCDIGQYRADSIVFYVTGNFQTTNLYNDDIVSGNLARVYYGHSQTPDYNEPNGTEKILARRQTIITSEPNLPSGGTGRREYEKTSISEWNKLYLIDPNLYGDYWLIRPDIDINDIDVNDIPVYLTKGVGDFSVQFDNGIDPNGTLEWWPEEDNFPISPNTQSFFPRKTGYFPKAIKFNFTLYDSQGIIKNGKRFEHIVYLKQ